MMVCQGCRSKVYFVLVLPVIASPVAMPARVTLGAAFLVSLPWARSWNKLLMKCVAMALFSPFPTPTCFFLEKGWEEGGCKEAVCHGELSLLLFSFKC